MLRIPQELQKYVRMDRNNGLVHSDNMPDSLKPLFEETKNNVIRIRQEQRNELEKLIGGDNST